MVVRFGSVSGLVCQTVRFGSVSGLVRVHLTIQLGFTKRTSYGSFNGSVTVRLTR